MGEMLVSDLSMASRGDEYALSPAHICQPFSGGMVFYFYPYHIAWSLPRTLILVPSFFLTWSHVSIFLGGYGVFLLILFLFFIVSPIIVRHFSGGMVLVLMVSINTLHRMENEKPKSNYFLPTIVDAVCNIATMPTVSMLSIS